MPVSQQSDIFLTNQSICLLITRKIKSLKRQRKATNVGWTGDIPLTISDDLSAHENRAEKSFQNKFHLPETTDLMITGFSLPATKPKPVIEK